MNHLIAFRPLFARLACGLFVLLCLGAQAAAPRSAAAAAARGPANCSWDRPGHEPFMGDVVAAVDHYPQIPADVRSRLKARMAKRDYDDMVTIRRDSISGKENYENSIRGMHFGENRMCGNVTRTKWTPAMQERGLVYCDSGTCVLVPTVCRNVSLITRRPSSAVAGSNVPIATGPEGELVLEPPGAGPMAGPADLAGGNARPLAFDPVTTPGLGTPEGVPGAGSGGGGVPGFYTPYVPVGGGGTVIVQTPAVPEPGTWALMGAGLAALVWVQRRRGRGAEADADSGRNSGTR